VIRIRRRRLDEAPSVRLSTAAKLLDLSVPTIRAWIDRGLLEEVDGSSPRRVTLKGVLEVRPLVRELRALGRDRNLLEAVLADLDDKRTLSDRKLRKSLAELRSGKLTDITPGSGA
jgi:DNA-binding transcriptional MerR regulator